MSEEIPTSSESNVERSEEREQDQVLEDQTFAPENHVERTRSFEQAEAVESELVTLVEHTLGESAAPVPAPESTADTARESQTSIRPSQSKTASEASESTAAESRDNAESVDHAETGRGPEIIKRDRAWEEGMHDESIPVYKPDHTAELAEAAFKFDQKVDTVLQPNEVERPASVSEAAIKLDQKVDTVLQPNEVERPASVSEAAFKFDQKVDTVLQPNEVERPASVSEAARKFDSGGLEIQSPAPDMDGKEDAHAEGTGKNTAEEGIFKFFNSLESLEENTAAAVIGRAITDPDFRARLLETPDETRAAYELTAEETHALKSLKENMIERAAQRVSQTSRDRKHGAQQA